MSTVAKTLTARHGKARLALVINWQVYSLRRIKRDHWALTKRGGEDEGRSYQAGRNPEGYYCTCPDHLWRKVVCKHLGALLAAKLVSRARKAVANG